MSNLGVDILVTARDMASRVLRDVGEQSTTTGNKVENIWKQAGEGATKAGTAMTLGITVPLVGLAGAAANTAADFEQKMNVMQQASGANGAEMERLSDLAKRMGADTVFSAGEAADAMLELAKAGMTPAQVEAGGLAATMALAASDGMELGAAATVAANAMNAFGISADEAGTIADALAAGATASTASVGSLAQGLSQVGMQAKVSGLSLNDTVGVLAAFDQAGIKGSDAGTSLKTMLMRLVPSSKEAADKMAELGLKFTDAHGNMLPITNVAEQLQNKLGGLTQEQRIAALTTMFGSDATRAATVMMEQGAEGIGKFIEQTKKQGAAQEMADARMKGTKGAIEQLKGSVETAGLAFGETLLPVIADAAAAGANAADKFVELWDAIGPTAQKAIVGVLAVVAAIGPLLLTVGKLITAGSAIATFFSGPVGTAILGAVGPVLAVVAVIAALVAAFVLAWNKSAEFRNFWIKLWADLQSVAAAVGEALKPSIDGIKQSIANLGISMQPALDAMKKGWDALKPAITAVAAILAGVVMVVIGLVVGLVNGVVQALPGLAQAFAGVFEIVGGLLGAFVALFTGNWSQCWEYLKTTWDGICNLFVGGFAALGGMVSGFVSGVIGFFKKLWDVLVGHSIVPDMVNAIIKWFTDLGSRGRALVSSLISRVIGFFSNLHSQAVAKVAGLVNAVVNKLDSIFPGFKDIFNKVTSFLGGLGSQMLSIGGNIIDGLINGIRNGLGRVMSVAREIANSVKSTIKNALGINSPSRFTEWVGRMTNDGWEKGLKRNGHVIAAAGRTAEQVKAAVVKRDEWQERAADGLRARVKQAATEAAPSVGAGASASTGAGGDHYEWNGDVVISVKDLQDVKDLHDLFTKLRQRTRMAHGTAVAGG